jgi:hypothetical protein
LDIFCKNQIQAGQLAKNHGILDYENPKSYVEVNHLVNENHWAWQRYSFFLYLVGYLLHFHIEQAEMHQM